MVGWFIFALSVLILLCLAFRLAKRDRVVVHWGNSGSRPASPFAQPFRHRVSSRLDVRDPSQCSLLFWKIPNDIGLIPRLADLFTGRSRIWMVAADFGLRSRNTAWVITSGEHQTLDGPLSGPHYAPAAACHGESLLRMDVSAYIHGPALLRDLQCPIASPAIRHKGIRSALFFLLGISIPNQVVCSSLIGRAIRRQPNTPLARALERALRERFTYGELAPADLARAVAILARDFQASSVPFELVPLFPFSHSPFRGAFMKRKFRWPAILSLAAVALLWFSFAQSAPVIVPFFSTPYVSSYSSGEITVAARQADLSYTLFRFGTRAPYGLLSSMEALAQILSGGSKLLLNAPAGPANVGRGSQIFAFGDFTGDGSPGGAYVDVVRQSPLVTVYLGTPAALFKGAAAYSVGTNPAGVIAEDFNHDGKLDLAVVFTGNSSNPGGIAILLNKGDGTFSPAVILASGLQLGSIAVLDINHDGILDIVGAGYLQTSSLVSLLGKGDGTFNAPLSSSISPSLRNLTLGDFNGDGNIDAAAISDRIVIALGKGDGTFRPGAQILGSSGAYIAAGDLNGDGKLDLAVANSAAKTIDIAIGKGDGNFALASSYIASYNPTSIVITDYNHDGKLDVLNATGDARGFGPSLDSGHIDTLIGNGDGTFQGAPTYHVNTAGGYASFGFTIAGDFDGDGKTDALAGSSTSLIGLLKGNGDGTFRPSVTLPALATYQTSVGGAVAGDFNGDGRLDVAITEVYSNQVDILLGSPTGLTPSTTFNSGGSQPTRLATGDFNGDGKLDLAVLNPGSYGSGQGSFVVFTGGGNGAFTLLKTYPFTYPAVAIAAVDLNHDGKQDLIVTGDAVYVYLNDGQGGFQAPAIYPASATPHITSLGDLNGDGKTDLVVSAMGDNFDWHLALLLGNGDGTFQPATLLDTDFGVEQVAIQDFNGDGKVDLAVTHCCGATDMTFLAGNGDGTFQQPEVHFAGGDSPIYITATDLNGDGRPDLLIGGNYGGVTALLNNSSPLATTVNSASFASDGAVAADSIASVFGADLANTTASTAALGTNLGGTTVTLTDSAGTDFPAPLFFVSKTQVNLAVPAGLVEGLASVSVTSGDGIVSKGLVTIVRSSPGIFALDNHPFGSIFRVDASGKQTSTTLLQSGVAGYSPAPIDLNPATDSVYLILYGTGLRGASLSDVTVNIGSAVVHPIFAGAQGAFTGEDQINVQVPYSLKGSGDTPLSITAYGRTSNEVRIVIQ